MSERQLATIRKIAEVQPIPNADKICAYRTDGWLIVDSVGKYNVGDLVVMCEIDSWVPTSIAPFLTKAGHEPKEFEGVKGERLRTIKLRGQVSQGLLLPLDVVVVLTETPKELMNEGDDVTEILGILKYEKPLPAALAGMAKGNFPSFIPKTDQPRIQNCTRQFEEILKDSWSITEKLDGSSMTVYVNFKEFDEEANAPKHGVCSRNLDLKFDEANSFWEAAIKFDLIEKIASTGRSLAIQGELVGEGIQGNSYKLIGRQFFCFDIWDIDQQRYLLPTEMFSLCNDLEINTVPEVASVYTVDTDIAGLLLKADGESLIGCGPKREGFVFKSNSKHDFSFKTISNTWLQLYE